MKRIFLFPVFVLLLAACGDSSGPGASSENFCEVMASFSSLDVALENIDLSPESIEEAFEAIEKQVEAAAKVAPGEIKDDMETLSEGISLFVDLLRDVDFNLFGLGEEEAAALEDPEIDAAGDRVNAYVKTECGIDLDEDSSADFSTDVNTDGEGSSSGDLGASSLEGDFETLPPELQASIVDSLVEALGVSPESVVCLIESAEILDATELSEQLAGNEAFAILDECGLDFADFGTAFTDVDGVGLSDDQIDEEMDDFAIEMMAELWQTEPANVECLMNVLDVADPFLIGAGGADINILDEAADCGIDLAAFGFGS